MNSCKKRKVFVKLALWSLLSIFSLHFSSCNFVYRFFLYIEEGNRSYPCLGVYSFEIIIYDLDEEGNRINSSNYIKTLQLAEDGNLEEPFWNNAGLCAVSIALKGQEYDTNKQLEVFGRDSTNALISRGRSPVIKIDRSAEITNFYMPLYRNCTKFPEYNKNASDEENVTCKSMVAKNAFTLMIMIQNPVAREKYATFEVIIDGRKYRIANKDKTGVIVITNLNNKTGSYEITGVIGSRRDRLKSGKYNFANIKTLVRVKGSVYQWGVEQIEIR